MTLKRIGLIGLVLGVGLGTAACTDGYGYSGVSLGYGAGGYGSGGYYGDPYNNGYGYGNGYYDSAYGSPYYGWYNDFYYPGTGIYVYDQYRRPYRWNNTQQRYWQNRRNNWRGDRNYQNNWGNFQRDGNRDGRYDGRRDGRLDGRRDNYGDRGTRRYDGNRGSYAPAPGVNGAVGRDDRRNWNGAAQATPDARRQYRAERSYTPQAGVTTNAETRVRVRDGRRNDGVRGGRGRDRRPD